MACRFGVPRISTGGRPSRVWMRAPIICSGTATRSIGRRMSDSSPINVESKRCGASIPIMSRMAVPALPMSSGPRGGLPGDGGAAFLVARAPRPLGVAGYRDLLDARQVLLQPLPALAEGLGVRADTLDARELAHGAHEVVPHAQLHLPTDLERRAEEAIEGVVDRALGGVLDRHHAEVGAPGFDLVKDLID